MITHEFHKFTNICRFFSFIYFFFFFFFQAEDGIRDIGVTGVQTCALPIFIRGDGVAGLPARIGLFLALISTLLVGCGGGGGETTATPPATPAATAPATTGAETTAIGRGQAETVTDEPFMLNTEQPVPPDFVEAYQRRALISVQFYKEGQDPLGYPQGLEADQRVRDAMERLRTRYPTIRSEEHT